MPGIHKMASTQDPQDKIKEARQIAAAAGMFISAKAGGFTLYRKTDTRPVWLGSRKNEAAICALAKRCAVSK